MPRRRRMTSPREPSCRSQSARDGFVRFRRVAHQQLEQPQTAKAKSTSAQRPTSARLLQAARATMIRCRQKSALRRRTASGCAAITARRSTPLTQNSLSSGCASGRGRRKTGRGGACCATKQRAGKGCGQRGVRGAFIPRLRRSGSQDFPANREMAAHVGRAHAGNGRVRRAVYDNCARGRGYVAGRSNPCRAARMGKTTTLFQIAEGVLANRNGIPLVVPLGDWATEGETVLASILKRQHFVESRRRFPHGCRPARRGCFFSMVGTNWARKREPACVCRSRP